MTEIKRPGQILGILVGIQLPLIPEDHFKGSLGELELLAETAGIKTVEIMVQKRDRPDPSTYIGKGKIEEIKHAITSLDVDLVIFNDSLSPVQIRNLETLFDTRVIDRTQLILDIFASRAQTKESKLQVELAQLQYLLPRLAGIGKQLSRLGGGIGTRGPGETKLETDRRRIRQRISDLKDQLKLVVKQRELQQQRRKKTGAIQVILTGYTNAGKSTILNRLTAAEVLEENRLFATLDPTMRKLVLPKGIPIVLVDTVGFIQDLPTHLVAAFRSTLEVVNQADIILHVIDGSDPDYEGKIEVVETLLEELNALHIPRIRVFNKKDLLHASDFQPLTGEEGIWISAIDREDQQRLLLKIEERLLKKFQLHQIRIPFTQPHVKAKLYQVGYILKESENLEEECWEVEGLFANEREILTIQKNNGEEYV